MTTGVEQAIAEIKTIVGDANLVYDPAQVETLTRDISLWRRLGAAVVYPGTAEEVSRVVKLAAAHRLPDQRRPFQ
jgi:FAD/FMN-containing dehydrogenase